MSINMSMKRFAIVAVLVLGAVLSANAQKLGTFSVGVNGTMPTSSKHGSSKIGLSAEYLFNLGGRSHLGLGAGAGYGSSFINDYDEDKTIPGVTYDDHKKNLVSVPVYLKYKVDMTDPSSSHPYLAVKAGSRFTFIKGMSKNSINPLLIEFVPSVGYDFRVGGNFLGVEVGADMNMGQYDRLNVRLSDKYTDLNGQHYLFDKFACKYHVILGLTLSVYYSF